MQRLIFFYLAADNATLNSTSDHFGTNPVDIEKSNHQRVTKYTEIVVREEMSKCVKIEMYVVSYASKVTPCYSLSLMAYK